MMKSTDDDGPLSELFKNGIPVTNYMYKDTPDKVLYIQKTLKIWTQSKSLLLRSDICWLSILNKVLELCNEMNSFCKTNNFEFS